MERKNGYCYAFAFRRIRIWASKELADCRQSCDARTKTLWQNRACRYNRFEAASEIGPRWGHGIKEPDSSRLRFPEAGDAQLEVIVPF